MNALSNLNENLRFRERQNRKGKILELRSSIAFFQLRQFINFQMKNPQKQESKTKILQKSCPVCQEASEETQILVKGLQKRLMSKKYNQDQQYQQVKADQNKNHAHYFAKALEMVAPSSDISKIASCCHKKYYMRLRTSQAQLKRNCQQIISELGHRNYQLDLLLQQISGLEANALESRRGGNLTRQMPKNGKKYPGAKRTKPATGFQQPKLKQQQIKIEQSIRIQSIHRDDSQGNNLPAEIVTIPMETFSWPLFIIPNYFMQQL